MDPTAITRIPIPTDFKAVRIFIQISTFLSTQDFAVFLLNSTPGFSWPLLLPAATRPSRLTPRSRWSGHTLIQTPRSERPGERGGYGASGQWLLERGAAGQPEQSPKDGVEHLRVQAGQQARGDCSG